MSKVLKIGTRSSNLALIQSRSSCDRLNSIFSTVNFELVKYSSPGDRDKKSDLLTSSLDFFTRDLDEAVFNGEIDCAIHSAKDIAYPINKNLDWFWLPWKEDCRDACVTKKSTSIDDISGSITIGVSSERRIKWCKEKFPSATVKSIRGDIEQRIMQLDKGEFDIIIVAVAALNRLGLQSRITRSIPLSELETPEGQGRLAITFKRGNSIFNAIRSYFNYPLYFVGAGIGTQELITVDGMKKLLSADIVLYDYLLNSSILKKVKGKKILVGKRSGQHSMSQEKITELIAYYSRCGKRVVRLKGGDSSIFGRLEEECLILDKLNISYSVIPGVSSITAATTSAGLILTGRNIAAGFTVLNPRVKGGGVRSIDIDTVNELPKIFFMSISEIKKISEDLLLIGIEKTTPATVIFAGCTLEQMVVFASIETLYDEICKTEYGTAPGLIVIGESAIKRVFGRYGTLNNEKVLITGSDTIYSSTKDEVLQFGGTPINFSLIKTKIIENSITAVKKIKDYNWLILTSPFAVRLFLEKIEELKIDVRALPKIALVGKKSASFFYNKNIFPELVANSLDSATELISMLSNQIDEHDTLLYLKSDKADNRFESKLSNICKRFDSIQFYNNCENEHSVLPDFTVVLFASCSAVKSFEMQFGIDKLQGKTIVLIGLPTKRCFEKISDFPFLLSENSSVENMVQRVALFKCNRKIESIINC